jgi:hypothetical protein
MSSFTLATMRRCSANGGSGRWRIQRKQQFPLQENESKVVIPYAILARFRFSCDLSNRIFRNCRRCILPALELHCWIDEALPCRRFPKADIRSEYVLERHCSITSTSP